jgi:hypothetical protein
MEQGTVKASAAGLYIIVMLTVAQELGPLPHGLGKPSMPAGDRRLKIGNHRSNRGKK